jgi:HSP20 family protein
MIERAQETRPVKGAGPLRIVEFNEFPVRAQRIFDTIARRAFEIFEASGRAFGHDLEDWFQAEAELLHPVHAELVDTEGALELRAEVPGFTEKDLEVKVEPRRITIAGERQETRERKEGATLWKERCANRVFRVFDLPVEVKSDKITATLKEGILEIKMPKAEPAKKVQVAVKAA